MNKMIQRIDEIFNSLSRLQDFWTNKDFLNVYNCISGQDIQLGKYFKTSEIVLILPFECEFAFQKRKLITDNLKGKPHIPKLPQQNINPLNTVLFVFSKFFTCSIFSDHPLVSEIVGFNL